ALAVAALGELPHGFVSERAAAADDSDRAALVDVAGRDADAAAAVRIFPDAGRDEAGTVRPDEPCPAAAHCGFDFYHVVDRDALRNRNDEREPGIDALQNRISGERWWNENHG